MAYATILPSPFIMAIRRIPLPICYFSDYLLLMIRTNFVSGVKQAFWSIFVKKFSEKSPKKNSFCGQCPSPFFLMSYIRPCSRKGR